MIDSQYNSFCYHRFFWYLNLGLCLCMSNAGVMRGADTKGVVFEEILSVYCQSADGSNLPVVNIKAANRVMSASHPELEFVVDVLSKDIPQVFVEFVHCDPSWHPTSSSFINSGMLSTSVSTFVRQHRVRGIECWEGRVTLPNPHLRFEFSGNYELRFKSFRNPDSILFTQRLLVTEQSQEVDVSVYSGQLRNSTSLPRIDIDVSVRKKNVFIPTATVLYQFGNLNKGFVVGDRQMGCDTCGITTSSLFSMYGRNMPLTTCSFRGISTIPRPRKLDITSSFYFPSNAVGYLRRPDKSRSSHFYDAGPTRFQPTMKPGTGGDNVLVQLDVHSRLLEQDVYVVGSFNNWSPRPSDRMMFDVEDNQYKLQLWLKRGVHGYCYVFGSVDSNGIVATSGIPSFELEQREASKNLLACTYTYNSSYGGYYSLVAVSTHE